MIAIKVVNTEDKQKDEIKSMVRKEVIEELVINTTIEKLSEPKIMNYIVSELLQIQAQQLKENTVLKVLEKQKRQVDTALNNLVCAVERTKFFSESFWHKRNLLCTELQIRTSVI